MFLFFPPTPYSVEVNHRSWQLAGGRIIEKNKEIVGTWQLQFDSEFRRRQLAGSSVEEPVK
jgi:hypothetical protein